MHPLPNPENAIIDIEKLRNYCLSPDHRRGEHKARMFLAACGMTAENADELREALLEAVRTLDAKWRNTDSYGRRYMIDLEVTGPTGKAPVRSA